LNNKIVK